MTSQNYYANRENCRAVLTDARRYFGDKSTSAEQFEAIFFCLGMVILYCTPDLTPIARATLDEATLRHAHFSLHVWPSK